MMRLPFLMALEDIWLTYAPHMTFHEMLQLMEECTTMYNYKTLEESTEQEIIDALSQRFNCGKYELHAEEKREINNNKRS